jgi:hypothetical protein
MIDLAINEGTIITIAAITAGTIIAVSIIKMFTVWVMADAT